MNYTRRDYLRQNAGLYLSVYLLQEIESNGIDIVKNINLYKVFPELYQIYNGLCPLGDILIDFLNNNIVESVILKIELEEIEEIYHKKKLNIAFFELGINKLFRKGLNNDQIQILLIGLNQEKLKEFINEYLYKWEKEDDLFIDNYFFRKDKQVKLVLEHIDKIREDYPEKNLKIIGSKFKNKQVDILAVLLYLERINKLKFKYIDTYNNSSNLKFVIDVINENNTPNTNINKEYEGLRLTKNFIKDNKGNHIYYLKDIEYKILKSILDNTDKGGINLDNIIKITQQTKDAFKQYLKVFRKNLKNIGLDSKIIIKYDTSERTYKGYIK